MVLRDGGINMGILSAIFGTGKVIEKGLGLIDSFHTSDTEMIEAKTKAKVDLMKAYAPFKIAQRYLALLFSVTFISSFILALYMTMTNDIENIDAVKDVLDEFYIGEIMMTIIFFYFGGGAAEGFINSRKK